MEGLAQAAKKCWAALGRGVLGAKARSVWTSCSQTITGANRLLFNWIHIRHVIHHKSKADAKQPRIFMLCAWTIVQTPSIVLLPSRPFEGAVAGCQGS